jgi:ABC-type multidrug transport system fused ATPase/permease subunit
MMLIGMLFETVSVGAVIPALSLVSAETGAASTRFGRWLASLIGSRSEGQLIAGGLLLLLMIFACKSLFLLLVAWRQSAFLGDLQSNISARLFETYLRQPWTFHLQRNSAELIRNNTTEVRLFLNACQAVLTLASEFFVALGVSVLLIYVEPIAAVFVGLALGGATWVFQKAISKRLNRWGQARQCHEGKRVQHVQQGLGGAKEIKLLGREKSLVDEYLVDAQGASHALQRELFAQHAPRLWYELLAVVGFAGLGLVLLWQGYSASYLIPRLGLFGAAAFRLLPSLNRMLLAWNNLNYFRPAVAAIQEDLKLCATNCENNVWTNCIPFEQRITLSNVSFTYPGEESPTLRDVSLSIERGAAVGIIGGSGAGKSTLVDLILGLLSPDKGVIAVDGRSVNECLRGWQNGIGYVSQSIFLTDDTIRRNVAFGVPVNEIDDAAVTRALKAAQLEQFVQTLPYGVETFVGERGVRLSGGQRQRIGIARALYHDPPVLVLDEATSSLDNETEAGVMAAVNVLHGSKTLIIVAHRLSTVSHCDELLELQMGQVVSVRTSAGVNAG